MHDRLDLWRRALDSDPQSIRRQLTQLAWDLASFRAIVRMIREHRPDEDGEVPLNGNVMSMLRDGFWTSTFLAFRRLVDTYGLDGSKGVYSLHSVLTDIERHRDAITRRNFIEAISGLPYDPGPVEQAHWDYVLAQPPNQAHWIPRELDATPIHLRHAQFDFLSGKHPDDRDPDDRIQARVFERLHARIASSEAIAEHVNVHYAHASTPESRQTRGLQQWNLDEAEAALKNLAETAELISRWFINEPLGPILATPQFDQFRHLDRPLMPTADMTPLQEEWDAFGDRSERWTNLEDTAL